MHNILLGGGVTTSNVNYQGDSCHIGFFNAINTSLGIDQHHVKMDTRTFSKCVAQDQPSRQ